MCVKYVVMIRQIKSLLIIGSILISTSVFAQAKLEMDSIAVVKPVYLDGDAHTILMEECIFPEEAIISSVQGDVVLSVRISSDGVLDSLETVKSTRKFFTVSSLAAMDSLNGGWKPAMLFNEPVNKRYYIVFRYRKYGENSKDFRQLAQQSIKEKDFKNALRYYNKAIKDNGYDSGLYSMRSLVHKELGNTEESRSDIAYSILLQNNILTVVDASLDVIGIRITTKTIKYGGN